VTGTETDSCPSQVETEIWESQASWWFLYLNLAR
jgi:hypothetical protein